jgi:hypothetical protein
VRVRVVAVAEGEQHPLVDRSTSTRAGTAPWDELREQLMARGTLEGVHVFVVVLLSDVSDVYYYQTWIEAVRRASGSAWGARVIVVLGGASVSSALCQDPSLPLTKQLETALDQGATHVLHDELDEFNWQGAGNLNWLHQRLHRLMHLERLCAAATSLQDWRVCVPVTPAHPLAMGGEHNPEVRFLREGQAPDDGGNPTLIVVAERSPHAQVTALEAGRPFASRGQRHCAVVTLRVDPTPELLQKCADDGLAEPPRLGLLEARALTLRLNRQAAFRRGRLPPRGTLPEQADLVRVESPAAFLSSRPSPLVLITSAFPSTQKRFVREAAEDVGCLVRSIPEQVPCVVMPLATPQLLGNTIDHHWSKSDGPNVWIHGGHGSLAGELTVGRLPFDTHTWLGACGHGRARLALAVFLACHSADVARAFAQAGAGVAVGFDNTVWTHGCREFAARLLRPALASRLNRDSILEAFQQAALMISGPCGEDVQPRAFVADR